MCELWNLNKYNEKMILDNEIWFGIEVESLFYMWFYFWSRIVMDERFRFFILKVSVFFFMLNESFCFIKIILINKGLEICKCEKKNV